MTLILVESSSLAEGEDAVKDNLGTVFYTTVKTKDGSEERLSGYRYGIVKGSITEDYHIWLNGEGINFE